jgi:hypothetical protein
MCLFSDYQGYGNHHDGNHGRSQKLAHDIDPLYCRLYSSISMTVGIIDIVYCYYYVDEATAIF